VSVTYLDTHVAVWLHDGLVAKLTRAAKREVERSELRVSPIVLLELDYLYLRGKLRLNAQTIYANLDGTFGVSMCPLPFSAVIMQAMACGWTQDPFDRIIVGHAWANQSSRLITADTLIREHYPPAVW
jgi:PIN domain nuclease of toxin-antitoxin system